MPRELILPATEQIAFREYDPSPLKPGEIRVRTRFGAAKPHPRSYGSFTRKIRKYVLEDNVVSLEQAIRSMTSLPATAFRIRDRGTLRPGAYADVVVFASGCASLTGSFDRIEITGRDGQS